MIRRIAFVVLACAACSGPSATMPAATRPPSDAVRSYIYAVEHDDPGAAWAMLSSDVRARSSYDSFQTAWRAQHDELVAEAAALAKRLASDPPLEHATLNYGGTTVELSRSNGPWQLDRPFTEGVAASSPWEAVKLFAEAMERRDFRQTMRLVTGPLRTRLERELDDHVKALRKARPADLEKLSDTRFRLRFGDYELELQKDKGAWKIADMQ